MMLPNAPAHTKVRLYNKPLGAFSLMRREMYTPMATAATSRNPVSKSFPATPGSAQPKAMPSFSMNCSSKNAGHKVQALPHGEGRFDPHLDELVNGQYGHEDAPHQLSKGRGH